MQRSAQHGIRPGAAAAGERGPQQLLVDGAAGEGRLDDQRASVLRHSLTRRTALERTPAERAAGDGSSVSVDGHGSDPRALPPMEPPDLTWSPWHELPACAALLVLLLLSTGWPAALLRILLEALR